MRCCYAMLHFADVVTNIQTAERRGVLYFDATMIRFDSAMNREYRYGCRCRFCC